VQRSEDDTWDLATSVGATATMVAAARARATRAAEPLIDDPLAEPLVRAVGVEFFTRWATGELDPADVDEPGAPWGMQRMTDLMAGRTRYFDDFFREATAAGIRQAVILASGLDSRAYRLAWPAGTVVFEIDQPQVLEFKIAKVAELGAQPKAELHVVPIDLRQDWPAALRRAGFDSGGTSAWIAEGLLPFLPPDAQDRLLDSITALSAVGSRLATETFFQSTDAESVQSQQPMQSLTERWREHGFDLEFAGLGYDGARNDVETYLANLGWTSVRTELPQLLVNNGLPPMPRGAGGAAIANNYYCTSILRGVTGQR
jgi:methyltransferase (TIGR00027 family)